jgi:hypothetical protein
MTTKLNTCSICGELIPVEESGWALGHNAEPVVTAGRCCEECSECVVIPTRLRNAGVDVEIGKPLWPRPDVMRELLKGDHDD